MSKYVVGFLFLGTGADGEVVLIIKKKPEWQAGKLNGVGGQIELFDADEQAAMEREWKEETGEERTNFEKFLSIQFNEARVTFFRAFDSKTTARTNTSEMVVRAKIGDIQNPFLSVAFNELEIPRLQTLPNLKWIIPMALSGDRGDMRS